MAAKKKKTKRPTKKAAKNPRRYIPKTTRGRKPIGHHFTISKYGKDGEFLGNITLRNVSVATAENRAAKEVKGKVAKAILAW